MLVPLLFENYVIEPSNVPRFLFAALVLVLFFISRLKTPGDLLIPSSSLLILLTGYYLWNLIAVGWSLNKADAIYESQKAGLVPLLLIFFINSIRSDEQENRLSRSLILISAFYLFYAIYQFITLPDLTFESLYNVRSFAEHKNILASYLFLLSFFQISGLLFLNRGWRIGSLVLLCINCAVLLLLQVRSVYVAMVFTGFFTGFFLFLKAAPKTRKVILIAASFFLAVVAFLFYFSTRHRLGGDALHPGSVSERFLIWQKTWLTIRDHFFFGVGPGNWQYNFMRYGISDIPTIGKNQITFQRPHNDLLWIASETGLIGILLILGIIALILVRSLPAMRAGTVKTILLFSFLAGLLIESCFSFPKERISHIVLASLLLALLLRETQLVSAITPGKSRLVTIAAIVVLFFSAIAGSYRIKGEYYTRVLLQAQQDGKPATVISSGKKAVSVFYQSDPTSTPIYSYLGWAYDALQKKDSMEYASAEAYHLAPYDFEVLCNYGYALCRERRMREAESLLRASLQINEQYEPARFNMMVLKYNSGQYREAMQWLSTIPGYRISYAAYYDKINARLNPGLPK